MDNNEYTNLISRDSSPAVMQDQSDAVLENGTQSQKILSDAQSDVEKMVKNDLDVIRSLMGMRVISREQGQDLMKQVIKNAYTNVTTQNHESKSSPEPSQHVAETLDVFAEFALAKPDFFKEEGRNSVLDYLKNANVDFDKDELLQISQLIEAVEQGAVEKYLKKLEYGKSLNDENAIAKRRLTANAYHSNVADNKGIFTRSQIGKMSGEEFTKYEDAIMEQLRKGLIK